MNPDEKIDLLRRSNFMHVDKKSETIAVRHCSNIHYHRCFVLEGVRRAVLRNLGSSDETNSNSIIDPGAVGLFSQKYTTPFEVIEADLTRICRDMHRIFIDSLWDVYLCLLYEELEAYKKLVKRNPNFGYAPLTDFLNSNKKLLAHLRELRDSVLHPQSRTSFQDALEGIVSSADRQREPLQRLIIDAQFLIDAHTVRFWYSMGSHFITEGDKEIASRALESRRFSRIEKLNRIAEGICHRPLPHWPNPSDLRGIPSQIQFFALEPIRSSQSSAIDDSGRLGTLYPDLMRQAKRGCVQMIMRALAFYNEFTSYIDPEKLVACPVDPSKDMSIDIEQFFRADTIPKTEQDHHNQQALLRVTLALLHEPLRLYKQAIKRAPTLRIPALDTFVESESDFAALKSLRKSVFHVPRDNVDLDSRELQFMYLSTRTLDVFEPLMNFYRDCPDGD